MVGGEFAYFSASFIGSLGAIANIGRIGSADLRKSPAGGEKARAAERSRVLLVSQFINKIVVLTQ